MSKDLIKQLDLTRLTSLDNNPAIITTPTTSYYRDNKR